MSSVTTFVGLDYHQDSVQVCILDQEGKILCNRPVENNAEVIVQVATPYGKPRRLAIEACSGAADLAEELATKHDLPIDLAHPGYVARMKRSPDKTDYSDAHLLAASTASTPASSSPGSAALRPATPPAAPGKRTPD